MGLASGGVPRDDEFIDSARVMKPVLIAQILAVIMFHDSWIFEGNHSLKPSNRRFLGTATIVYINAEGGGCPHPILPNPGEDWYNSHR